MTERVILWGRRFGKTTAAALAKAHVDGYDRRDGTHVDGYETKAPAAKPKGKGKGPSPAVLSAQQHDLFGGRAAPSSSFQQKYGGGGYKAPQLGQGGGSGIKSWPWSGSTGKKPDPQAWHPKVDDDGKKVGIDRVHKATDAAAWSDPLATATVPAGGEAPAELHGVPFAPWEDAPTTLEGWAEVPGQDHGLAEPDFDCPPKLHASAGVIVQEPDGRYWLVSPTNQFGGYRNTFPKGRADDGLSLQATAIKEAYEESGLQVAITGFLGDFARTNTYTRYYLARRVGGTPSDMGWESQAVRLAPAAGLEGLLNGSADKPIRDALLKT